MFRKTIEEQLPELQSSTFDIIDADNTVVLQGGAVLDYFKIKYLKYRTLAPLSSCWVVFMALHKDDMLRAYEAAITEYEPLSNYDKHEINAVMSKNGDSTTDSGAGEGGLTTTNEETSDESSAFRNVSKSTTEGTTTTTLTRDNTAITYNGKEYDGHDVTVTDNHTSGNIGVTTSQQMLQSEYELRLQSALQIFLDMFIREYSYYVWDGEVYAD